VFSRAKNGKGKGKQQSGLKGLGLSKSVYCVIVLYMAHSTGLYIDFTSMRMFLYLAPIMQSFIQAESNMVSSNAVAKPNMQTLSHP
jgi:hypothetical protein